MRLALWFLILSGLILGIWGVWGGGMEERFTLEGSVAYLKQSGPYAWLAAWLLLISDIVLPVPGTVVMSALGYIYGTLLGGLLAAMGSMLAGLTAYSICRLMGERGARLILGEKDYRRGHEWFERGGAWLVCISRALPILPEVVACTAGLVGMSFRRFMISLACGSLPMGFVFAAIGSAGHDRPALAMALSMAVPVILWTLARLVLRRLEKREEER